MKKETRNALSGQTLKEEIFNSISHGIGSLIGIIAMVILIVISAHQHNIWKITGFTIYGISLILLYTMSTLYHSLTNVKAKKFFRIMDHVSIYVLIAGTYTPILLIYLKSLWGWTILTIVWTLAITGIILKSIFMDKIKKISLFFYLAMGWVIIIAIKPLLAVLPHGLLIWIAIGGLFYTLGTIFYANHKIPYNHAIWHVFVLLGSLFHTIGLLIYTIKG